MHAMRFFNTAGPMKPDIHYCIPPLERLDAEQVRSLIRQQKYFVLHAPRQTGKTSALLALQDELNAGGHYRAVYVNVEVGQSAREDVAAGMQAILSELALAAEFVLDDLFVKNTRRQALEESGPHDALRDTLSRWAAADSKPIVLLIDEVDTLVGDTLVSVLRQLRAGYTHRPNRFPQSVILCGIRDVRDYRIHASAEKAVITGGSAFNIKAESLRMGDFSATETQALLSQHSDETGQAWTEAARQEIRRLTQGQPWLVNALAYRACETIRDPDQAIDIETIHTVREQLILRRETHLDQLTDKLQEERVRRVVEPLLSGNPEPETIPSDDLQYVRDLGLVRTSNPIAIANPIYQEVIPRDLTWTTQASFHHDPAWYIEDGDLKVEKLLAAFQTFFREHSEHWVQRFQYREAGPQLLLQAFLQRIVNSGGRIEREYGLGRMRTDLLIVWPVVAPLTEGRTRHDREVRKTVIEYKLLHGSLARTIRDGLAQTRAYMDRCAAEAGHLVVFDRTAGRSWDDKIFRRTEMTGGPPVTVWGM